jgi:hypothetical protein
MLKNLNVVTCCYIFNKATQSGQSGSEVPKFSERNKSVPALMKLILCMLDDVALLTDLSFLIYSYTSLNAEQAAFRTSGGKSAHSRN